MRLLLLSIALLPLSVFAHGVGPSLEAEVGEYLIDIGYTPDLAPGTEIAFDIDLFTTEPIDYADFASVDVRVTKEGAEIVAGSVENDAVNIPTFGVTFPEPGGYDIDIRYLDEEDALIVARTFHVEVPTPTGVMMRGGVEALTYAIAAVLLALSIGIGGYSLWQRFSKPSGR